MGHQKHNGTQQAEGWGKAVLRTASVIKTQGCLSELCRNVSCHCFTIWKLPAVWGAAPESDPLTTVRNIWVTTGSEAKVVWHQLAGGVAEKQAAAGSRTSKQETRLLEEEQLLLGTLLPTPMFP